MNGLTFFLLLAGPGLVLILNHLSKAQSGRVSPARLDWGQECFEVEFFWPELSGRGIATEGRVHERHSSLRGDSLSAVDEPHPRPESLEEAA